MIYLCFWFKAFFAKYDAVQLYLSTRTYPQGLNYVEKNTFRRFCKKFTIKGSLQTWMLMLQLSSS